MPPHSTIPFHAIHVHPSTPLHSRWPGGVGRKEIKTKDFLLLYRKCKVNILLTKHHPSHHTIPSTTYILVVWWSGEGNDTKQKEKNEKGREWGLVCFLAFSQAWGAQDVQVNEVQIPCDMFMVISWLLHLMVCFYCRQEKREQRNKKTKGMQREKRSKLCCAKILQTEIRGMCETNTF